MVVHLVDGTYELFRHFYGNRRAGQGDRPRGAVDGVLGTVRQMLEGGATHIGVATDHVIESFRNDLWPGYKTGEGIEPALNAQFHPLEDALVAMGVVTWPMIELEADDALASAAHIAARMGAWRESASGRPTRTLRNASQDSAWCRWIGGAAGFATKQGVRDKFGVAPAYIADYLALVGDAADGYPGIAGIGAKTAARLINRHGHIEQFPGEVLGERRERALLFKTLATLRIDAPLFDNVDRLRWSGPTEP